MKNLTILRKLISIYYYITLLIFAIGMIVIPYRLSTHKKMEMIFSIDAIDLNYLSSLQTNIILLYLAGIYILYILAIKLIKDTVDQLSKGVFFTTEISRKFKNIGRYFVVIGIYGSIVKWLIDLTAFSRMSTNIEVTMLVFILFGLFFMFLSEAFAKAQTINEENNLTI